MSGDIYILFGQVGAFGSNAHAEGNAFHQGQAAAPQVLPLKLPFRPLSRNPGLFNLLAWRSRITDLIGRDAAMDTLLDWAGGDGIDIKLVCGPGGVGKTRLAAELADRLRGQGWAAGFLDFPAFAAGDKAAGVALGEQGTLIIVDYPEGNRTAIGELLEHLAGVEETPAKPLRLLLLTRGTFDQWAGDFNGTGVRDFLDEAPLLLDALPEQNPWDLYQAAVARYAAQLERPAPTVTAEDFQGWLDRDRGLHSRPLFILALALHGVQEPEAKDYHGPTLIHELCGREQVRLERESVEAGMGAKALSQLLALAAVAGALDDELLIALAKDAATFGMDLPAPEKIIGALDKINRLENRRLPAPVPDIVAAELTVMALLGGVLRRPSRWVRCFIVAWRKSPRRVWRGWGAWIMK